MVRSLPQSEPVSPLQQQDVARIVTAFDKEHGKRLFRTICKQLRGIVEPNGCMDVYQVVLIAFWRVAQRKIAAGRYDEMNPMRLALGIASREIRNAKRMAYRRRVQEARHQFARALKPTEVTDDSFRKDALEAFQTLPPAHRRVVDAHLAYIDSTGRIRGGRYAAIASQLQMSKKAVRGLFRRAIVKIARHLRSKGWPVDLQ